MTTPDRRGDDPVAEGGDPLEARVIADLTHYYTAPAPVSLRASVQRLVREQARSGGMAPASVSPSPLARAAAFALSRGGDRARRPRVAWLGWVVPALVIVLLGVSVLTVGQPARQGRPGMARSPLLRTVAIGVQPIGAPLVDEQSGRVFVSVQGDSSVRVLDSGSGSPRGTVAGGGGNYGWLAVLGGRVYLSSFAGESISVLDARSGAVLHTAVIPADSHGDRSAGPFAVDEQTGRLFMAHYTGDAVSLLDPRSGAIVRRLPACHNPAAVAVSTRTGHLFAKCNDGTTAMLDERSGRILARAQTASTYGCMLADERTNRIFELGTPLVGQPHLDVLDASSGRFLRATALRDSVVQDAGGRQDCPSMALDERTGRVYVVLRGASQPGRLALKGAVAVVDGRTGSLLRRIQVAANPVSVAVDGQTGHVLVASAGPVDSTGLPLGNGTLAVLDGASGRVRRTVAVGINPAAVVVDERDRRALVLNSNTDINGMGLMANPRQQGTLTMLDLTRL